MDLIFGPNFDVSWTSHILGSSRLLNPSECSYNLLLETDLYSPQRLQTVRLLWVLCSHSLFSTLAEKGNLQYLKKTALIPFLCSKY